MAITFITGNPGSGKSYLAVYEIYRYFYRNKAKKLKNENENLAKYKFCFTNINQFKFEKFENVREFDLEVVKFHLTALYDMYLSKRSDKELLKYCKDNEFDEALFVVDEVHNIFKGDDEILIWWLTYHRHLYHDLILITQDLVLVPNEYKRIAEFFYKAVDSGKRIFSNRFRYFQFSNYKMYQNSIIKGGTINLKFDSEVFDLYHSGNSQQSTNYLKKYLVILSFLLSLLVFLSFYFFSIFGKTETPKKEVKPQIHQTNLNNEFSQFPLNFKEERTITNKKEFYVFDVSCVFDYCEIKQLTKPHIKYVKIPTEIFNKIFNSLGYLHIQKSEKIKGVVKYFFTAYYDLFSDYEIYIERVTDEKSSLFADVPNIIK